MTSHPELCDDARRSIHNHLNKLRKRLGFLGPRRFEIQEELIDEYLVFMHLKGLHRAPGIVGPSCVIDDVWNAHIVDTKNYRLFCNKYFGEFIDRDPNVNHGQQGRAVGLLLLSGRPMECIDAFWPK